MSFTYFHKNIGKYITPYCSRTEGKVFHISTRSRPEGMLIPAREFDRFSKLFMYLYATPPDTDSEPSGFNLLYYWPVSKLNLHLDHVAWKRLFNYLQGNNR